MKTLRNLAIVALLPLIHCACVRSGGSHQDRDALEKTSEAIRAAFRRGDVATIIAYHHPDVIKALSFQKYLIGRKAVAGDLRSTLEQFSLEFEENRVESLLILGNTAIEQTIFAIQSTPKHGGKPYLFKGRTQVVYVRYKQSPTGWASIREMTGDHPACDQLTRLFLTGANICE